MVLFLINCSVFAQHNNTVVPNKVQPSIIAPKVNLDDSSDGDLFVFKPFFVNRKDGFYLLKTPNQKRNRTPILEDSSIISKADIDEVKASVNYFNQPSAQLTLNKKAAATFGEISERNIGKPLAIVINKKVIMMPILNSAIWGGKVEITDGFTFKEIEELVKQLKSKP